MNLNFVKIFSLGATMKIGVSGVMFDSDYILLSLAAFLLLIAWIADCWPVYKAGDI